NGGASALGGRGRTTREATGPSISEGDAHGVGGPCVRDRDGVGAGNAITGGDGGDAVALGDREVSAGDAGVGEGAGDGLAGLDVEGGRGGANVAGAVGVIAADAVGSPSCGNGLGGAVRAAGCGGRG